MNNFKKLLFFALVPFLFAKADLHHHDDDRTVSERFSDHRKNHHRNREDRRRARRHHDDDYKHRNARVGNRPSSRQNFPERVAQPVVTAGGTVADVAEDVVELRPVEAVEDTVRGAGQTAKDVLAIPFGGRNRDYRN